MDEPRMMDDPGQPVLSSTEARGAVRGHGVRYVLYVSLTLVIVAFVIAYLVA